MRINVTKPYLPNIDKYKSYIDQIYQNEWLTNNGPLAQKLERALEQYLGVKNLLLVTNGTVALNLAYKLLGISGDVITTPFSFVATSSSLMWDGINPIFSDIKANSFNIDPGLIRKKITSKTAAILPVHVFGNPCEVELIQKIADEHNLKVIYDAAHAFGVMYKGKSILEYGDISTLSFHATKLFHTIEGGALIIKDNDLYQKAKRMINFGLDGVNIECLGGNFKMNEFQAAMGLAVLEDIDSILTCRKNLWQFYYDNLQSHYQLQVFSVEASLNYHYFPVVFQAEDDLLKSVNKLNQINIFPRRYFYPSLNKLNFLDKVSQNECPISESLSRRILCLPIYAELESEIQRNIIEVLYG